MPLPIPENNQPGPPSSNNDIRRAAFDYFEYSVLDELREEVDLNRPEPVHEVSSGNLSINNYEQMLRSIQNNREPYYMTSATAQGSTLGTYTMATQSPSSSYRDVEFYTLDDDGTLIRQNDRGRWKRWMEHNPEQVNVGLTIIEIYIISTVFLGVLERGNSHRLFKTMITNKKTNGYIEFGFYKTKAEAQKGHQDALKYIQSL